MIRSITCTALIALFSSIGAMAQTGSEAAEAFAIRTEESDQGYEDFSANLLMTLENRHGQNSTRELRLMGLEQTDDGDKTLVVFDSPADVKGTALLSFAHFDGDDDQWLYLPALKRVKRISSSNQSGSFMGSEFAYEDFSSDEVQKYTYHSIAEDTLDGEPVTVIERSPKHSKSGYTRQIVYYSNDHLRPVKIEYYDRKNDLLKIYTATGFEQYEGKHWRPKEMFMENVQNGKTTRLTWSDYAFKTGLSDRDFDKNALARAR